MTGRTIEPMTIWAFMRMQSMRMSSQMLRCFTLYSFLFDWWIIRHALILLLLSIIRTLITTIGSNTSPIVSTVLLVRQSINICKFIRISCFSVNGNHNCRFLRRIRKISVICLNHIPWFSLFIRTTYPDTISFTKYSIITRSSLTLQTASDFLILSHTNRHHFFLTSSQVFCLLWCIGSILEFMKLSFWNHCFYWF